jgi:hypothetical protein
MGGAKDVEDTLMDWILYKKELAGYEALLGSSPTSGVGGLK